MKEARIRVNLDVVVLALKAWASARKLSVSLHPSSIVDTSLIEIITEDDGRRVLVLEVINK